MKKLKCQRCGYRWYPRDPDKLPKKCAQCNNRLWNIPRKKPKDN